MRLLWIFLLLTVVCITAYSPRKSADDGEKKQVKKVPLTKKEALERSVETEEVEEASFEEIEEDAGVVKPKGNKKPSKQTKKEKSKAKDNNLTGTAPTISSDVLFDAARRHRIEKLKDLIGKTLPENVEQLKEIREEIKNDEEDDAEGEVVYEACAGGRQEDELCHCSLDEIDCSKTYLDAEDPSLRTTNLEIQKKNFVPLIANFSDNGITRLEEKKILPKFEKSISVLDFCHNEIRFIDSNAFVLFKNLSKLDLSHNNLQKINKKWFAPLGKTLHRLDLSYNKIQSLSANMFEDLTSLKKLILDGNQISAWNKEHFKGLDNLEELSLDDCKIEDLPGDLFEYLPKLNGVSLRTNPIDEIPRAVSNSANLKILDLSESNIAEVHEKAFAGDSKLEEVILEKMKYLSVVRSCAFCQLSNLKTVILSDNEKLVEIHPNAFGFINGGAGEKAAALTELDIHNCNISSIDENMINYGVLETFKISGNPWLCDCKTAFLMSSETFTFKQDTSFPRCNQPEKIKNRNLATLQQYEACEKVAKADKSARFSTVFTLGLLTVVGIVGGYLLVSSGKLQRVLRRVQNVPEVSYSNLTNRTEENLNLDQDFQPRAAEV